MENNKKGEIPSKEKSGLHPRNPHRFGYDFAALIATNPSLEQFVITNKFKTETIDFSNPAALKSLNASLLMHHYDIKWWDIPAGYLVPPIPGRADYIHCAADLLASVNKGIIPRGHTITVLDIGVGASCVYPIVGVKEYDWSFVGTEVDIKAIQSAQKIITSNEILQGSVEIRHQKNSANLLYDVVVAEDEFDLVICNPPFHASMEEVREGAERKWNNLKGNSSVQHLLNFGGNTSELIFPGGEAAFVNRLISQSVHLPTSCYWYTTLISKELTLKHTQAALKKLPVTDVQIIQMSQGQKQSRLLAWTFLSEKEQRNWRERHFWSLQ